LQKGLSRKPGQPLLFQGNPAPIVSSSGHKNENQLTMRKTTLFTVSMCSAMLSTAQAPTWEWAKSAAGSSGTFEDVSTAIAVDNNGNTYSGGFFRSSTMSFGSLTLTNQSDTYYHDAFIVKYDPAGNVLWGKSFGSSLHEEVNAIETDAAGNSYILGEFASPSVTFGNTVLTNNGGTDVFLVKLDPSGNVLWAKAIGGTGGEESNALVRDANGDILTLSNSGSPALSVGSSNLTTAGSQDLLIVKYAASGNVIWAKTMGGAGADVAYDIAADATNNFAITGRFSGPSMTDGTGTVTNTGNTALFVIKFNSAGTYQWSSSWSGSSADYGASVAMDSQGNVLMLARLYELNVTFGSVTLTCTTTSYGLIKYNAAGTPLWGETVAGGKIDGVSIKTNALDHILLCGTTICPQVVFGGYYLNNTGSGRDLLVVKYDSNANELWGVIEGGNSEEYVGKMDVDASGNVYIYGMFLSTSLTFGGTVLTHTAAGQNDNYIAKLSTSATSGIHELSSKSSFTLTPNPMTSETNILSEGAQIASVRILDASGKTIRELHGNMVQPVIERGEMTSGAYFIQITDKEGAVHVQKLLVE
jgi:hypothetical protein